MDLFQVHSFQELFARSLTLVVGSVSAPCSKLRRGASFRSPPANEIRRNKGAWPACKNCLHVGILPSGSAFSSMTACICTLTCSHSSSSLHTPLCTVGASVCKAAFITRWRGLSGCLRDQQIFWQHRRPVSVSKVLLMLPQRKHSNAPVTPALCTQN